MGCSGARRVHDGQLRVVAGLCSGAKGAHYGRLWVV
jgi:hypothetical protein